MAHMQTQMTRIGIGCREAARVFGGSPTAPDPVFAEHPPRNVVL
jgi:hypothetical protein